MDKSNGAPMKAPDYATRFDPLSFSACFIQLFGVRDLEPHATGFFWRNGSRIFLVTNWHVVTGINIIDGKTMMNNWVPEKLSVEYFTKFGSKNSLGLMNIDVPKIEIALYEDFHSPFWIQHSRTFDWGIDIVAIEVSKLIDGQSIACVNDTVFSRLLHFAGSDIFVLGHPLPKKAAKYPVSFPVWKRGSIASEILIPWDMRPAFLIDCRTSKGMPGSPVFSRAFGPVATSDFAIDGSNIKTSEFMGVYSGRLHDDENNASLSLVWHRTLIDELLSTPSPGSRDWNPTVSKESFALHPRG